jgi:cytoplasmic iron level regulating protein YaaA (DUF328/UPF0246 family)
MLFLLSPAKSLDYRTPLAPEVVAAATPPLWTTRAAELIALMRQKTPSEVASLMNLSDELAALNVGRYAAWSRRATPRNSRPAALAFDGDVYDGLAARNLPLADLEWAQSHLVILSGLYGVLRPLDRLQPYRLEMGTRLTNDHGRDLYAFWGDAVARYLDRRVRTEKAGLIVNLASQEYFRVVDQRVLRTPVLHCRFEEQQPGGEAKIVSFFAKRARGAFARWAIENRVDSPADLAAFDRAGYAVVRGESTPEQLVFRREAVQPQA